MKRLLQRTAMLIGGLLMGLICAEVACKIMDVTTAAEHSAATKKISRLSDDPDIRYELIPGVEDRTPGQRHTVRVNNLGFRGKDISPNKEAGTIRIAVLGDSIAFGRTYAEEAVFPAVLETLLTESMPDQRFEVINASLSGRDTWEEAAVLERRVLPLDPDVVILQICMNDHVRLPKPDHQITGAFGERPWYTYSSLLSLFDTRSHRFRAHHVRWLKTLGLDARTPAEVVGGQVVRPDQMLNVEKDWEIWSKELLRIADRTRAHGAAILFVAFPLEYEVRNGYKETLPALTQFTAQHGIYYLDMLPLFRGRPDMLRDYTHPSTKGHYVTAHELSVLVRKYLDAGK